jgi:predicted dehydrogenase
MPPQAPLSVGLVGAGPWALKAYVPMLSGGPETRLAAVWARRPEAAHALAEPLRAEVVQTYEALLDRCDAVAFAVPPDVQSELAIRAARAGKHLLLDKPLGLTLDQAERLAGAVGEAGVISQVMLTQRFRPSTQAFIEEARTFEAIGATLTFLSSAFVRGPYATPWRREYGALHDFGPHAFDLLDAALGPIRAVAAHGDPRRWVGLTCTHESGAVSTIAMSGVMELEQSIFALELFGGRRRLLFDAVATAREEPWAAARRSFVDAVRAGRAPELDVQRGLLLQTYIDRALRAVAS